MQSSSSNQVLDMIFAKLSGLYGSRFTNMWAAVDPSLVRKAWASELGGFLGKPDAIRYAFEHLPEDHPPTALAFRKLCNQWTDDTPRLPAPTAKPPKQISDRIEELKRLGDQWAADNRAWARRIIARSECGDRISPTTLRIAREALAQRGQRIV